MGHAVSDDLVHWTTRPSISTAGAAGAWDGRPNRLTGMVVRHDDRFFMFLGATHNAVQLVGVYCSDDLDNWTAHPSNPVMCPKAPHYLDKPRPPQFGTVDWRDPCITYREQDGHYHALICARLPKWSHAHSGAAVGHLRSRDLIHWEHLPPLEAPLGKYFHAEVPDIFELGGRHYLLFSTNTRHGIRLNTPRRENVLGTFYLVGDHPDGPFSRPDDDLLIGASGRMMPYVGRTIAHGGRGGRLLYHHIRADRSTWGAPKMIGQNEDGTLYLRYMLLLEKLETGTMLESIDAIDALAVSDLGIWRREGAAVTGRADVLASSCKIARSVADLHLSCRLKIVAGSRAGVMLRNADHTGVHVMLDHEHQRAQIGMGTCDVYVYGDRPIVETTVDTCSLRLDHGTTYHLRCFARDEHFEVYLDDRWLFTAVLNDAAKAGDVDLYVERGQVAVSDIRLAAIEPLA